jgi:hypothetical protein
MSPSIRIVDTSSGGRMIVNPDGVLSIWAWLSRKPATSMAEKMMRIPAPTWRTTGIFRFIFTGSSP